MSTTRKEQEGFDKLEGDLAYAALCGELNRVKQELADANDLLERIKRAPLDMYDEGICVEINAHLNRKKDGPLP